MKGSCGICVPETYLIRHGVYVKINVTKSSVFLLINVCDMMDMRISRDIFRLLRQNRYT
jgi:hypothetical protein